MSTAILNDERTAIAFVDAVYNPPIHFAESGLNTSGDATGIELRMLPPYIKNNHTFKFWPFPGRARLYCLTLVISDSNNQLAGHMELDAFPRIGDHEYLPVNKTVYYWQDNGETAAKAPGQIHLMCSVIKSKEGLRDTGDILSSVKEDRNYKNLMEQIAAMMSDPASYHAVTKLTLEAAKIVGQYLGHVEDQPIGTVFHSFTHLHGDWDRLGITPIKTTTRDVDFNFELIIRDKERNQP